MTVPHVAQLRAMLAFERSLVDRVGPPGCAARETAAANVAALEWVLPRLPTTPPPSGRYVSRSALGKGWTSHTACDGTNTVTYYEREGRISFDLWDCV